ncbi:MAG: hypothetical protein LQ347_004803 [Umbilicaria vellea]|nr:MAG: hypothetical protein LQ347_004803 [Umbilicaria vellea]
MGGMCSSPQITQAKVKVGSSSHVVLEPDPASPIILYLPPWPSLDEPLDPPIATAISVLNYVANATTVQINYRASSTLPFPTPVHDVLAGYDWVLKNLIQGPSSWHNPPRPPPLVGICGEVMGGSLATMLALTECRSQKPGGICAAALGNPIADWTFPVAETPHQAPDRVDLPDTRNQAGEPPSRKRSAVKLRPIDSWTEFANSETLSAQALISARDTFFTKPEKWFDPFASPLLFFRTASTEIPTLEAPDPGSDRPLDLATLPVKKRKARRRYPPLHSDLKLPTIRIDVGEESLLRDQGVELVERVKKSSPSYMKQAVGWDGEWLATEQTLENDDVQLVRREGVGLWGEAELTEVGVWLNNALRRHRA